MMKNFDENLLALIKRQIPLGKAHALPNKHFREVASTYTYILSDKDIRVVMQKIRLSKPDKVLAGDGNGYYWAATKEEALEYLHSLDSRIKEMRDGYNEIKLTYLQYYDREFINKELLEEHGFVLVAESGYNTFHHPTANLTFKASTTHVGCWGWFEGTEKRKLFYKKTQLIEFFDEKGIKPKDDVKII